MGPAVFLRRCVLRARGSCESCTARPALQGVGPCYPQGVLFAHGGEL
jgi:hypothetical protein